MARKILLADDSVTAQNMGRRILSDAGYEVVTVNNGSAALKKIAELKPDLVVLDVYMPGYGGLEVCQRLKENRETARIPVLLSVGKLEPFKADEARRVRADAYIVKPFEASELLTALTKLEDKIVPGPEPYKPGRFAKAVADLEQSTPSEEDIGLKQTGWKDRLVIPRQPAGKEHEPDQPESGKGLRSISKKDKSKSKEAADNFERPIPAGLPADITPEEIAAITAAAAVLTGERRPVAEPVEEAKQSKEVEEAAKDSAPTTFASAPIAEEPAQSAEENAEEKTATEAPVDQPKVEEPSNSTVSLADQNKAVDDGKHSDAEVLAALAMLGGPEGLAQGATAAMGASAESRFQGHGPRWIAEEISPEADEATFILEREMEKAYAAMAAADFGQTQAVGTIQVTTAEQVSSGSEAPAHRVEVQAWPAGSPVSGAESATPESTTAEMKPAEATAYEQESGIASPAASVHESLSTAQSQAASSDAGAFPKTESAYAAAAAASGPVAEYSSPSSPADAAGSGAEAASTNSDASVIPSESVSAAEEDGRQGEAELAAAWANWRQIRENIVGPQSGSPDSSLSDASLPEVSSTGVSPADVSLPGVSSQDVSLPTQGSETVSLSKEETSAQTRDDSTSETTALETPAISEKAASAEAADPSAISSIVDNMLAELKPRLMEEIAKKLAGEKKS